MFCTAPRRLTLRRGTAGTACDEDLPTEPERAQVFTIHLARRKRPPENFDVPAMAANSKDFSGAEIEEVVISAMYDASYAQREVTTADILASIHQTVPRARTMDEQINRLRSWASGRARDASTNRAEADGVATRRMEF